MTAFQSAGTANAEKIVGSISLLFSFSQDEALFFLLFVLQLHKNCSDTVAASARVRGEVMLH